MAVMLDNMNNREVPMATVLGIAWVAFAVGLFAAAVIAVAGRPEITVVAGPPTTKAVVEIASAATTTREPVTTAKPTTTTSTTTTTTEPPTTTRYVPYVPPTIPRATDEAIQRAALEAAWNDSDMDLCVAVDGLGMEAALDAFMEGSAGEFDRWLVEEFFADKCGY